jgi:putative zinc finger/helix-turn-helix YgiT family protein
MQGKFTFAPPAEVPGGPVIVDNASWLQCDHCGENILSPELESALDRQRYVRLELLTPGEIRRVREKSGLSAVEMARLLGVGDQTYTRWENGRSLQNKSNDTLIRLFDCNSNTNTAP